MWPFDKKDKVNERTPLRGEEKKQKAQNTQNEKKTAEKADKEALIARAFDELVVLPYRNPKHLLTISSTWIGYELMGLTAEDLSHHLVHNVIPKLALKDQLTLLKKAVPAKSLEPGPHETGLSAVIRNDEHAIKNLEIRLEMTTKLVENKPKAEPKSNTPQPKRN